MRSDRAHWARLRKDGRSNGSAGLAIVSAILAVAALQPSLFPGSTPAARLNPFYWLLLLPVAWWGAGLTVFEPTAVRLMRPVAIAAPLLGAGAVLLGLARGANWVGPLVLTTLAFTSAVASLIFFRNSLLEREGPAR